MTTLTINDEHPPLRRTEILQPQTEHLAAAQPAQQHRFDHGPIPPTAQRH
jgi:hypothetical protein